MLESLKYKNHINEVIDFGESGIYVNTSDLRDHEWTVTQKNNKIASLSYGVAKRSLPVTILCSSVEEGIAAKNKLFEVTEKDALAMQPGKIIIGNYYFQCYVTRSKKSDYLINKRYLKAELTLVSDRPYWVRETQLTFNKQTASAEAAYLDYPFDYAFDYSNSSTAQNLNNTGFVDTSFKIIIYGACTNPKITIGSHVYQVNAKVEAGELLTIDSTTKKIYLTAADGTRTNKFNSRNKESYIFEKIKPGLNSVLWDGSFNFDIIVMEERSEPKWT